MTRDEALDEAEKRWGDDALALELGFHHFAVGTFLNKEIRKVYGEGESWEEAFADAAEPRVVREFGR